MSVRFSAAICAFALLASAASAAFVADEFDGQTTLGAQWSFIDGSPTGAVTSVSSGAFHLTAAPSADQYYTVDRYACIQQDAPAGTNWEVTVKMDNFDPTAVGKKLAWNKAGLMLWQDIDHWILLAIQGDSTGNDRELQGMVQYDNVPARDNDDYCDSDTWFGVTSSTLYFKLQKTPRGYCGFASGNGTNWTQITAVIRNPETSDGYFTNEKIRLMTSGGPNLTPGSPCQADFDYVRYQALSNVPSGYKLSEEFNSLDTGVWTCSTGIEAGQISTNGGYLDLQTTFSQDEWKAVHHGIFAAEDAPTSTSYGVVIKAEPTDLRGYPGSWWGWGLKLWQDQNDWVMITCLRSSEGKNVVEAAYTWNDGLGWNASSVDMGTACPGYLRIDKKGSNYLCMYSSDNVNWTPIPSLTGVTFPSDLRNAQIRVLGKRWGDTEGALIDRFDWVHIEQPFNAAQNWNNLY